MSCSVFCKRCSLRLPSSCSFRMAFLVLFDSVSNVVRWIDGISELSAINFTYPIYCRTFGISIYMRCASEVRSHHNSEHWNLNDYAFMSIKSHFCLYFENKEWTEHHTHCELYSSWHLQWQTSTMSVHPFIHQTTCERFQRLHISSIFSLK